MSKVQAVVPPEAIGLSSGLTEQELRKTYIKVLHNIFVRRTCGAYTDKEQQAMADAVREFYGLLIEALRVKDAGSENRTVDDARSQSILAARERLMRDEFERKYQELAVEVKRQRNRDTEEV